MHALWVRVRFPCAQTLRSKQMGPALLPTPLSPPRGHHVLDVPPASRSSIRFTTHLAADVYDRSRSVLHSALKEPGLSACPERHVAASGFVTGARAGIRRPQSQGSTPPLGRSLARALRLFLAKPRLFALVALNLRRSLSGCPSSALDCGPSSQSFTSSVLRACLKRSVLRVAEAFGMTSLNKHVDSCQRGFRYIKHFRFSALRLRLVGVLCSEDKLKVRPNPLLDKGGKRQLSTFPRISCGQGWTTQPFTALDRFGREPIATNRFRLRKVRQVALCESFVTLRRIAQPLRIAALSPFASSCPSWSDQRF